jgi:hypothetical protein
MKTLERVESLGKPKVLMQYKDFNFTLFLLLPDIFFWKLLGGL